MYNFTSGDGLHFRVGAEGLLILYFELQLQRSSLCFELLTKELLFLPTQRSRLEASRSIARTRVGEARTKS